MPLRLLLAILPAVCFAAIGRCDDLPASKAGATDVAGDLATKMKPFFSAYCNDCHADGADEGGLSLEDLNPDLSDAAAFERWQRIFDRVDSGEMPPPDATRVTDTHRQSFRKLLGGSLYKSHAATKGTVYRRLNRREYQNTLNDLFGTNLDLESLLPADGRSHEFDNVGESLSVSMVQLKRYLEAIDSVMDASIARVTSRPETPTITANYKDTREGEKHIGKAWKLADDGSVVFFRSLSYPTGMLRTAVARETGYYKIRVTGYAYQSDDPVTFAVGATTFQRGVERPTFQYVQLPPGKPSTIELTAWMRDRDMVEITPWGISDENYLIKKNGIDAYEGPGLAIKEVQLIGPILDQWPSRGHDLLFGDIERTEIEPSNPTQKTKSWYVPKFDTKATDVQLAKTLQRIATVAWRRPTTSQGVQPYVALYEQETLAGANTETALRTAVAAIFCAPDFLYLQEPAGWLDDYAIASRLSYFLSRTAPDKPLLDAAAAGKLSQDPGELLRQTRRLLNDPRHQRFLVDFTDAWLNLRDIEFTSPDRNLYPEFDQFLKFSMLRETRDFLRVLVADNLPARNLISSDFAMLNNRLAVHYEIPGVQGPDIRRVELPTGSSRGGLLGQASVLKVSANGTNTSPVVRGVWVTERILGVTPPPPPPGISGVEPDIRGASTLRELLDKHRNVDSCRSCHEMIDPPGFALESFDPIGGWRERFRSLGSGDKVIKSIGGKKVRYKLGPAVDASGTLNGKSFDGFKQFRDHLAQDEDVIAKTLITKLLTFATGREMGFSDRPRIDKMVAASKAQGHGVKDVIELVVTSEAFRRK